MSATGVSTTTLAGVPLLAGAGPEALEALAADAYPRRVLAGEWLIREGDEADDLYVVLRGRLRAVAGTQSDGRTLRVLGPGANAKIFRSSSRMPGLAPQTLLNTSPWSIT